MLAGFLGLLAVSCGSSRSALQSGGDVKVPNQTEASTYRAECEQAILEARESLSTLEKHEGDATVESVLRPYNDLLRLLSNQEGKASLLRNVHPDKQVREAADWCEQELAKVGTDLELSHPIFEVVSRVDLKGADPRTRRFHTLLLRDYRRAGVDKSAEVREKIKKLQQELVKVGQDFGQNIRSDVREIWLESAEELAGLPQDYRDKHLPNKEGKIRITTDYPDYIPFMTFAKNDLRRKELYKVFRNRAWPKNDASLKRMLEIRYELANLLGFQDWADYVTEDKMIRTAEAAQDFIDKASALAKPRAEQDMQELLDRLKQIEPEAVSVGDWQKAYLEELVKRDKYKFDSQQLRPYFQYKRVQQGILDLTARMFGVRFRKAQLPVWHESVEAFEMLEGGRVIGRFYLDMHPREEKYKHAAAFPLKVGMEGAQIPEAALVCNFPGGDGSAGLMDHNNVETFLHEFGHLLHHLFAGKGQQWVTQSGIATEWDFVEAPSQLLEEWAWEFEVLKTFAKNAADEVIPEELVSKLRRSRDFGKGLFVSHQMYYAALSLGFYDRDPKDLDTTALAVELQAKYSPFAYVDGTHFQVSFGHLFGYSATYYTYMWSLVIAHDLFDSFQSAGLLNTDLCRKYRTKVLEPGGSKDAADLVKDFLGRPFEFAAFEAWLSKG